jgi:hypothetical protein
LPSQARRHITPVSQRPGLRERHSAISSAVLLRKRLEAALAKGFSHWAPKDSGVTLHRRAAGRRAQSSEASDDLPVPEELADA